MGSILLYSQSYCMWVPLQSLASYAPDPTSIMLQINLDLCVLSVKTCLLQAKLDKVGL